MSLVDEVIALDQENRNIKQEVESLRAEKNKISKKIGMLMAQGKKDEAAEAKETACINCGRCVEVCPSRIIPSRLADLSERHNEEGFVNMNGLECVECGSCSFVCPAKRNLKQAIGSMRKIALANKRK